MNQFKWAATICVAVFDMLTAGSAPVEAEPRTQLAIYGKGSLGDIADVEVNGTKVCKFKPYRRGGWICDASEFANLASFGVQIKFYSISLLRKKKKELVRMSFSVKDGKFDSKNGVMVSSKVGRGVSLWRISQAYAGFGAYSKEIFEQNRGQILDRNLIYISDEISIPHNPEYLGIQYTK